jgi:hypothetical protein
MISHEDTIEGRIMKTEETNNRPKSFKTIKETTGLGHSGGLLYLLLGLEQ